MFAAFFGSVSLLLNFASSNIQSYICQPPDKPSIIQPADASSHTEGPVTVSGIATASSQVTISVDSQASAQVTADAYNTFSAQVTLTPGVHSLGLTSDSPCGNSLGDPIAVLVTPAPNPPPTQLTPKTPTSGAGSTTSSSAGGTVTSNGGLVLQIATPKPDSRVTGASVYVSGTTSEPATIHILIGDTEVAKTLAAASTFGLSVPLQPGQNKLLVRAVSGTDQASDTVTVTRVVVPTSTTTVTSKSWWKTTLGIVIISVVIVLMIGLLVWVRW